MHRDQRVANYYSRSGVRGYCPFERRRPGGRYSPGSRRAYGDRSGHQHETIGRPKGQAVDRSRAKQQAPLFSSGLPEGPAAHSTGRVEVRQKNCRGAAALLI